MKELDNKENYNKTFEDIKHIDENEIEFWYARELQAEDGIRDRCQ